MAHHLASVLNFFLNIIFPEMDEKLIFFWIVIIFNQSFINFTAYVIYMHFKISHHQTFTQWARHGLHEERYPCRWLSTPLAGWPFSRFYTLKESALFLPTPLSSSSHVQREMLVTSLQLLCCALIHFILFFWITKALMIWLWWFHRWERSGCRCIELCRR